MKRHLTRRQSALLRLGALVLALILLGTVGGYGFTPAKALRDVERAKGTGRTRVIRNLGRLPIQGVDIGGTLSVNERALVLQLSHFHIRSGWQTYGNYVVDLTDDTPVHAGALMLHTFEQIGSDWMYHRMEMVNLGFFFGRVDDPEIAQLELRAGVHQWSDHPDLIREVTDTWTRTGVERYFLLELELGESTYLDWYELTACDADGRELFRVTGDYGQCVIMNWYYDGVIL